MRMEFGWMRCSATFRARVAIFFLPGLNVVSCVAKATPNVHIGLTPVSYTHLRAHET